MVMDGECLGEVHLSTNTVVFRSTRDLVTNTPVLCMQLGPGHLDGFILY